MAGNHGTSKLVLHYLFFTILVILVFSLTACSRRSGGPVDGPVDGGGTQPVDDGGGPLPVTVEETLAALGVDTDILPRTYPDGTEIPDSEHPYGSKLLSVGYRQKELAFSRAAGLVVVYDDAALIGPDIGTELYRSPAGFPALRTQAAVEANTQGDNTNEVLIVGVAGTAPSPELTMVEVGNANGAYGETVYTDINGTAVDGGADIILVLDIAAGDVDHDGRDEIAIVYAVTGGAVLLLLDDGVAGYPVLAKKDYTWVSGRLRMRVDLGNVDLDGNAEIGVLLSRVQDETLINGGTTTYFIYDYDAGLGLVKKTTGILEIDIGGGDVRRVLFGDIALGDIDGDGADEVVMAGVQTVNTGITTTGTTTFLHLVLDDALNGFAPLATLTLDQATGDPVREPHVETWDPDGDGIAAIQVHQNIYFDFATTGGQFTGWGTIPLEFLGNPGFSGIYERRGAAMAVADLDQDGREELIFTTNRSQCLTIFQLEGSLSTGEFILTGTGGVGVAPCNDVVDGANLIHYPIVVPIDIDGNASLMSYLDKHDVVYTEPIIIAALAAAPCYSDPAIGQDTDSCVTSFGKGSSTSDSTSAHGSVFAGVGIGWKAEAYGVGAEQEFSVTATVNAYTGWAHVVGETITYTGGAMTDSVVFMSIPYDRYIYTIANDPTDPTNNGEEITMLFPRKPRVLLVSRDFYNENTPADAHKLGAETFDHTVGDPGSYPTAAMAANWLDDGINLDNGLKANGALALSQTGSVEMELFQSDTDSKGGGIDFEFENSMQVSSGATYQLHFGFGGGVDIGWESTETTAVAGSVGAITDAALFNANGYSWGLGLYPVSNTSEAGQTVLYPLVNYWVEP